MTASEGAAAVSWIQGFKLTEEVGLWTAHWTVWRGTKSFRRTPGDDVRSGHGYAASWLCWRGCLSSVSYSRP